MADEYEVKVTVGDAIVEVKGARQGVVEIVETLAGILSKPAESGSTDFPPSSPRKQIDVRSFFGEKAPSTQIEALTVAAYYLAELAPEQERSQTIDADGATKLFKQAKVKLPQRMPQSLHNAKTAGYLDQVGPGEFRINPAGFNLVEHTLGEE